MLFAHCSKIIHSLVSNLTVADRYVTQRFATEPASHFWDFNCMMKTSGLLQPQQCKPLKQRLASWLIVIGPDLQYKDLRPDEQPQSLRKQRCLPAQQQCTIHTSIQSWDSTCRTKCALGVLASQQATGRRRVAESPSCVPGAFPPGAFPQEAVDDTRHYGWRRVWQYNLQSNIAAVFPTRAQKPCNILSDNQHSPLGIQ